MSDNNEQWITLKPHSGKGSHVQIDGKKNIVAGGGNLKGRNLTSLKGKKLKLVKKGKNFVEKSVQKAIEKGKQFKQKVDTQLIKEGYSEKQAKVISTGAVVIAAVVPGVGIASGIASVAVAIGAKRTSKQIKEMLSGVDEAKKALDSSEIDSDIDEEVAAEKKYPTPGLLRKIINRIFSIGNLEGKLRRTEASIKKARRQKKQLPREKVTREEMDKPKKLFRPEMKKGNLKKKKYSANMSEFDETKVNRNKDGEFATKSENKDNNDEVIGKKIQKLLDEHGYQKAHGMDEFQRLMDIFTGKTKEERSLDATKSREEFYEREGEDVVFDTSWTNLDDWNEEESTVVYDQDLHCRITLTLVKDDVIILENLNTKKAHRNRGNFFKLVKKIQKKYPNRKIQIDQIVNKRLAKKLQNLGWDVVSQGGISVDLRESDKIFKERNK